jgi:hypothetical protein
MDTTVKETQQQREHRLMLAAQVRFRQLTVRKKICDDGGMLMRAMKASIVHIPGVKGAYGGTTIVWRHTAPHSSVVELATSLQHPNDTYDHKMGRYLAAKAMAAGQSVKLRVPKENDPSAYLRMLFC